MLVICCALKIALTRGVYGIAQLPSSEYGRRGAYARFWVNINSKYVAAYLRNTADICHCQNHFFSLGVRHPVTIEQTEN